MSIETDYVEKLKKHFKPLIDTHGPSHLAVDWGSTGGQTLRFSVLAELLRDRKGEFSEASILDVGCGVGHFCDYLGEHGFCGEYQGVDLLSEMIEQARIAHPEHAGKFNVLDITANKTPADSEMYDYVVGSGLFYHGNRAIMEAVLTAMFKLARRGVAVNSLSAWAQEKQDTEFYACPLETLAFCRTLTPWVELRHSYMPHDFTIYLYREQQKQ